MNLQKYFPTVAWLFRTVVRLLRAVTWRMAGRICLAVFLALFLLIPMPRARTMFRAQKFHTVLAGLARVKVDHTTEAELVKIVPYLARTYSYTGRDGTVDTWYAVEFSNEFDWPSRDLNRILFEHVGKR